MTFKLVCPGVVSERGILFRILEILEAVLGKKREAFPQKLKPSIFVESLITQFLSRRFTARSRQTATNDDSFETFSNRCADKDFTDLAMLTARSLEFPQN